MSENKPGTFDSRIVMYETIHQITSQQKNALVQSVSLLPGEKVLDVCCGYGSATQWLVDTFGDENNEYFLSDNSRVQLKRAQENFSEKNSFHFALADVDELPYQDNFFDKVIIKMGLHENPKEEQGRIVEELFRILKPGGALVIWELYLEENTQEIFQKFIREKDRIAGFDSLVERRYFPSKREIQSLIRGAGFVSPREVLVFRPELHTEIRLDELVSRETHEGGITGAVLEGLAESKLDELNNFLRKLSDEEKEVVGLEDGGRDILIRNIQKAILVVQKP